jgi:two-component system, chemotaxis family, sensor kinase CheA
MAIQSSGLNIKKLWNLYQTGAGVVESLGPYWLESGRLASAILGDGRMMLIVDPANVVRQAARTSTVARPGVVAGPSARKTAKVLVVDDQLTVRELQRGILGAAGYRVQTACDGREALAALNSQGDFDIVVTDLQMPEMDGLALLAAIRADPDRSSLPVIIVTSRGSDEDRKRGAEAGADAYIVKDEFDQQALLETVERLVGSR